jgi:hypothetical protein
MLEVCPLHLLSLRQRNRLLELPPFEIVGAKALIKSVLLLTLSKLGALFLAQRLVSLPLSLGRFAFRGFRRFGLCDQSFAKRSPSPAGVKDRCHSDTKVEQKMQCVGLRGPIK